MSIGLSRRQLVRVKEGTLLGYSGPRNSVSMLEWSG